MESDDLDREVDRLFKVYGVDDVKRTVKRLGRKRAGRPSERDWALLWPFMQRDAEHWLAGRDPEALRTPRSIAEEAARGAPGASPVATFQRIYRKLRSSRRRMMLIAAMEMSEGSYPLHHHLRALTALVEDEGSSEIWRLLKERAELRLQLYISSFGEPAPQMSAAAIEAELDTPVAKLNRAVAIALAAAA